MKDSVIEPAMGMESKESFVDEVSPSRSLKIRGASQCGSALSVGSAADNKRQMCMAH